VNDFPHEKFGEDLAHFNFGGGPHDWLVPTHLTNHGEIAEKSACKGCFFDMETLKMKNVYRTIEHNRQYYDWRYLNQLVPVIVK
jgi:hypothetical protein